MVGGLWLREVVCVREVLLRGNRKSCVTVVVDQDETTLLFFNG